MRIFWQVSGIIALILGGIGALVPVMPTTPFILVAAFCFARSSPRLNRWLHNHPLFGPMLVNWNEYRAIPRVAKIAGTLAMAIAFTPSLVLDFPTWVVAIHAAVLIGVVAFLWSCPDPPEPKE